MLISDYNILVQAVTDNMPSLMKTMALHSQHLHADVRVVQELLCCSTGISSTPFFNSIFPKHHVDSRLYQSLPEVINYFSSKNLPFVLWKTHQDLLSKTFNKTLVNLGFFPKATSVGIACFLNDKKNFSVSNKITIKKVVNCKEYEHFITIFKNVFPLNEKTSLDFSSVFQCYENHKDLTHYIGYYENEAVATLTGYIYNDTIGLYNASTLPKAQGNGLCLALVNFALEEARKQDCKFAVSQLDPPYRAHGLSKKLGFIPCCYATPYIFQHCSDTREKTLYSKLCSFMEKGL